MSLRSKLMMAVPVVMLISAHQAHALTEETCMDEKVLAYVNQSLQEDFGRAISKVIKSAPRHRDECGLRFLDQDNREFYTIFMLIPTASGMYQFIPPMGLKDATPVPPNNSGLPSLVKPRRPLHEHYDRHHPDR